MNPGASEAYEKMKEKLENELHNEITSELEPFLNGIKQLQKTSIEYTIFKETYAHFNAELGDKKTLFASMLPEEFDSSCLKDNFYILFLCLGMVESVGNIMTDMLVMLIVANGKKFEHRRKNIVSINDLEDENNYISLGRKLKFLEENGLRNFVSILDSDFRNAIAHLNFEVKSNAVYIAGEDAYTRAFTNLEKMTLAIDIMSRLLKQNC